MKDYSSIPEHCREGVRSYVEDGLPMGDFLTQVFSNNLVGAFGQADYINRGAMWDYCNLLYNEVPSDCWGSREKVEKWIVQKSREREADSGNKQKLP